MPTEFVEKLYHKSWIPTVPSVTRIEYFIDQFDIEEYSIEDFINSLEKDNTFFDELFLNKRIKTILGLFIINYHNQGKGNNILYLIPNRQEKRF